MPARLLLASSLLSVALLIGLGLAYVTTGSELALAQAADSVADALTGLGLLWAYRVSRRPPDEDHPYGHAGAQPIAALVVAVLVATMAFGVGREAVGALRGDEASAGSWTVALVIGIKVAVKVVLLRLASSEALAANATLRAFRVDARSDVIVGVGSLAGLGAAQLGGWPTLDAWLALPVAAWIGWSGLTLARDSVALLMGTAPPAQWQDAVRQAVLSQPGVRDIADLKARTFGDDHHVWVEIHVDADLSVGRAHDIGEAVEAMLQQRDGISDAVVHVDAVGN